MPEAAGSSPRRTTFFAENAPAPLVLSVDCDISLQRKNRNWLGCAKISDNNWLPFNIWNSVETNSTKTEQTLIML